MAACFGVVVATWSTRPGPVPGLTMPGSVVVYGLPMAQLLIDLGATTVLGVSLLFMLVSGLVHPGTVRVVARARRSGTAAALVWLTASVVALVFTVVDLVPDDTVRLDAVAAYVNQFAAGRALVLNAGAAVLCLAAGAVGRRRATLTFGLRGVLAAYGLFVLAGAGHTAGEDSRWHELLTLSIQLHVLAAAAWTGGLAAVLVLVTRRRGLLAAVLPRFSALAGACLAVVAVSGLTSALGLLAATTDAALLDVALAGPYGRIALVKACCLAALAAIGGYMRYRLLPALVRDQRSAVVMWGGLEITIMGLAFGLAVALGRTPIAP